MKKRRSYELECRNNVYLLLPTNGVAKEMFSVVSVCLSIEGPSTGANLGSLQMFKLVQLGPLGTGTPSTLDMFKLFQCVDHTIGKREVGVRLKCLLFIFI